MQKKARKKVLLRVVFKKICLLLSFVEIITYVNSTEPESNLNFDKTNLFFPKNFQF